MVLRKRWKFGGLAAVVVVVGISATFYMWYKQRERTQAVDAEVRQGVHIALTELDTMAARTSTIVHGQRRYVANASLFPAFTFVWKETMLIVDQQNTRPLVRIWQMWTGLGGVPRAQNSPVPNAFAQSVRRGVHAPILIAIAQFQYPQFPWGIASGMLQVRVRATLFRSPGHPVLSLLPGT